MDRKIKIIIISIFLLTLCVFCVWIFYGRNFSYKKEINIPKENKIVKVNSQKEKFNYVGCGKERIKETFNKKLENRKEDYQADINTDNWKEYKNDILGISFFYPEKWGEPITNPIENINNLDSLMIDYEEKYTKSNSYYKNISVNFSKNEKINLMLFSDSYPGDYMPHADAIDKGVMIDNVEALVRDNSVCDYRYKNIFGHQSIQEIDSICHSNVGIKVSLVETPSENTHYGCQLGYSLFHFSFLKAQNGYFDNVLIKESFQDNERKDIDEPINTIDNFIDTYLSSETYYQDKSEFKAFVETIKTHKPADNRVMTLQLDKNDNEDTKLIKQYYLYIQKGELENAYALKITNQSLEDFRNDYKDAYTLDVRDMKRVEGGYEFRVDYRDNNKNKEVYHTIMNVKNGKLETTFVEKLKEELVVNNKLRIFVAQRGMTESLIIDQDGEETIVDSSTFKSEDDYTKLHFGGIKIYQDRYIIYTGIAWEFFLNRIYDMEKKEKVLDLAVPREIGFTKDGSRFFACALNHFGGEIYVDVYSVPEFKKKLSLLDRENIDYFIEKLDCVYDDKKNILNIDMTYQDEDEENCEWPNSESSRCKKQRKWIYSFDKNEAKEIDLKK